MTHIPNRRRNALAVAAITAALVVSGRPVLAGTVAGTACPNFPANSWWRADVSNLPVHARSAQWMSRMQPHRDLHPDFGDSFGEQPVPYGIPITIVDSSHAKVRVRFFYDDQSDKVRYPLGPDTLVEGGQWQTGDRHTVVVDRDTCRLYETWATRQPKPGSNVWRAGSGALWKLTSNALRPDTWTSADAAGFPVLAGLLTVDEVLAGAIDHAIRFTTDVTDKSYLWPARHQAGSVSDQRYPPMGARFRLKASYVIAANLRPDTKAILQAFKKYGLDQLKQVPASAFEAVDTSSLMISPDSMKVRRQQ
jgi:hypothetical protein